MLILEAKALSSLAQNPEVLRTRSRTRTRTRQVTFYDIGICYAKHSFDILLQCYYKMLLSQNNCNNIEVNLKKLFSPESALQ